MTYNADQACLYVVEIAPDRIKVGYSQLPQRRLSAHRRTALSNGVTSAREWISPPGTGSLYREKVLIDLCAAEATGRVKRESFFGVPFDVAVGFAQRAIETPEPVVEERPRPATEIAASAEYVAALLADWPEPTPEQIARVAALLRTSSVADPVS